MRRLNSEVWMSIVALGALFALPGIARADFTPIAGWDHQLFPSYLVATATLRLPEVDEAEAEEAVESESDEADTAAETGENAEVLGDPQGVLGVTIESPGEDTPVTVTITSDAILEPSTFVGTLEEEEGTYTIYPRIRYKYGLLARNKQSIPVAVTFRVEIGDEEPEEHTEIVTLRSVNDCPFAIVRGEGVATDLSFMFAAYVNEQHPFVDKVLREALNEGVVDSFTGYQSGDPAEVYRQVYALWKTLSERDVRYSNITTSAAATDAVYSQHVRLIDESINNAQANCVDGSVLLASLLRKVDIEPALVFVPGHCYLAFFLDAEQKHLVGLETTLIGSTASEEGAREIEGVENVVDETTREQNSWGTFCQALVLGNQGLTTNRDKFGDAADPDYQLIPIAAARRLGILPIAFDAADKFESSLDVE